MYLRKPTRRKLKIASFMLLSVVVFTPRFDLPQTPQLMALLQSTNLQQLLRG